MFVTDPTKKSVVAFSSSRSKRPHKPVDCPFCKGFEHLTPPASLLLPEHNWLVRCFPNAFPIVYGSDGRHEVVVESDVHGELFEDLSPEKIAFVFEAYQSRFRDLSKKSKTVLLFKNFGDKSGASILHEHAQVISLPFVPEMLAREVESNRVFAKLSKQKALLENKHFKAICPPFPRFPWEVWVLAKNPRKRFEDFSLDEGVALLALIQRLVRKIKNFSKDYTLAYHAAPKGKKLWFHVEIYPRKAEWGGIEMGCGVIVNFKKPEDAFRELKKA